MARHRDVPRKVTRTPKQTCSPVSYDSRDEHQGKMQDAAGATGGVRGIQALRRRAQSALDGGSVSVYAGWPATAVPASVYVMLVPSQSRSPTAVAV